MDPLLINRRIIYSPGDGRSTGGGRAALGRARAARRRSPAGAKWSTGVRDWRDRGPALSLEQLRCQSESDVQGIPDQRSAATDSAPLLTLIATASSSQRIIIIIIINNIIIISADIIGCSVHMRISAQNRWPCAVGLHDRVVCRFTIFQQAYSGVRMLFLLNLHRIMNLDIRRK